MTILQQIAELAATAAQREFHNLRLQGRDAEAGAMSEIVVAGVTLGRHGAELLDAVAQTSTLPAEVKVLVEVLGSQVDKGARV